MLLAEPDARPEDSGAAGGGQTVTAQALSEAGSSSRATRTQGRGEVETEMQPYIGKEDELAFNSARPDCQLETIVLRGETYPLVPQSPNQFE